MSIIVPISNKYLPIESFNSFDATFNFPTLGRYDFGVAANQRQLVIPLRNQYYYIIDRVSFSASIPEGVYLKAVDVQPSAFFQFKQNTFRIYPRRIPAINYKDNLEWVFWFRSPKGNSPRPASKGSGNELQITFEGTLQQVAELVGVPTITTQFSFVIYQLENLSEVHDLLSATTKNVGQFFVQGVS